MFKTNHLLETPEGVLCQTVKTQMKGRKTQQFIEACTDCLDKSEEMKDTIIWKSLPVTPKLNNEHSYRYYIKNIRIQRAQVKINKKK